MYSPSSLRSLIRCFSSSSSVLYRPRRSLFYVPGSNPKMLHKSPTLGADSLCFDLEDSVAPQQKPAARENILHLLSQFPSGAQARSERLVRINPVGSGFEEGDISTILNGSSPAPDGIVLPKVESSAHLSWLDDRVSSLLKKNYSAREPSLPFVIIALIESGLGILNLPSIITSSPRLSALIFGADDYAASVEAKRTVGNEEVFWARCSVLNAAKAGNLQAIDLVQIAYQDQDRLKQESEFGAQLGFTGKQAIHPKQLDVIHKAFSPAPERILWAERVVNAAKQHEQEGKGAFVLDNQMIDLPTVKQAQKVIDRARACGII